MCCNCVDPLAGPNTGGKTVALKTAGLMVIMAKAGLFLPVDAEQVEEEEHLTYYKTMCKGVIFACECQASGEEGHIHLHRKVCEKANSALLHSSTQRQAR